MPNIKARRDEYWNLVSKYDPDFVSFVSNKFAINPDKFPLAFRGGQKKASIVDVAHVRFGVNDTFPLIAGPCGLESREGALRTAKAMKKMEVDIFRGFIWKGRTNPSAFQGVGEKGLDWLREIKETIGIPIDMEVLSERHLELVDGIADVLQIGSRNMQNYELLKVVGGTRIPVILKNGTGAGIDEILSAAEYILQGGNKNVILCLRGTKSFVGSGSRFTVDMSAFSILKHLTHLPVIGDPTQGADHHDIIPSVGFGMAASGADGLVVEVHENPSSALTEKQQLLNYNEFKVMMKFIRPILKATGRRTLSDEA